MSPESKATAVHDAVQNRLRNATANLQNRFSRAYTSGAIQEEYDRHHQGREFQNKLRRRSSLRRQAAFDMGNWTKQQDDVLNTAFKPHHQQNRKNTLHRANRWAAANQGIGASQTQRTQRWGPLWQRGRAWAKAISDKARKENTARESSEERRHRLVQAALNGMQPKAEVGSETPLAPNLESRSLSLDPPFRNHWERLADVNKNDEGGAFSDIVLNPGGSTCITEENNMSHSDTIIDVSEVKNISQTCPDEITETIENNIDGNDEMPSIDIQLTESDDIGGGKDAQGGDIRHSTSDMKPPEGDDKDSTSLTPIYTDRTPPLTRQLPFDVGMRDDHVEISGSLDSLQANSHQHDDHPPRSIPPQNRVPDDRSGHCGQDEEGNVREIPKDRQQEQQEEEEQAGDSRKISWEDETTTV